MVDDYVVIVGGGYYGQCVVGIVDVVVVEYWNCLDMLFELGDLFLVGGVGIVLCCGMGVQCDCSGFFGFSDVVGIQMCVVGVIDVNVKFDCYWYIGVFGGVYSCGYDLIEQLLFEWQCCFVVVFGDFGYWVVEIYVDVIG